jgi:peptidoglycan/xylan/chitin deacetylase (PgdA/CDA1 family)
MKCRSLLFLCAASACASAVEDDNEVFVDAGQKTSEITAGATTVVSLTFDDTLSNQFQVADLTEARGMRAVFYINSTRIGTAGYLTAAQVMDLQTRGHEIGGHTLTHARLTAVTEDEARNQICNDRVALLERGYAVTSFAYPFGAESAAVHGYVRDCNYNQARDVGGLRSTTCTSCPLANPLPPTNRYAIRTYDSVHDDTSLAMMQQQVLNAESNGGGYVPIVFHHVCDNCSGDTVSPAQLAQFLDWLAARPSTTQVGTDQEILGGMVKPAVRHPAQPATSNLLKNASLEADADSNQVPDCWQRGGYGTNAATYTLVTDAFDGTRAQRIQITSFTSGGRRLNSLQDTGTCAPAITPGRRYTFTAQYKSNVAPRVSIYLRRNGVWSWFAESAGLPTSTTYRQASYTTPVIPADATHISAGVSIFAVGTLTVDAHSLVDVDGPPPATDNIVPLLAVTCGGRTCSTAPYAGPVSVALAASDAGGIREIRYTTNGSDPVNGTLYTGPITVNTTATVRAIAFDNAGNRMVQRVQLTIAPAADTTPPTLAISCNGAACAATAYTAPVTVALSASDAGSGVAEVRYTTDGSDPVAGTLYTAPFTVSATTTVRATAVDNAGNRTSLTRTITIGDDPPPPPTNLLQNPSLEVDANANQIPDCWQRGGYGTNTSAYTLVADAFEGAVAQRVDITSWTSGGRRLNSQQDTGTCAPAATPGRRYTMTGYYKSTIAPRFSVYVRSNTGVWRWFAESAPLPVSGTYVQATYTSPVMPADVTAISIGLSIFGVGSITTDAYTLVEAP